LLDRGNLFFAGLPKVIVSFELSVTVLVTGKINLALFLGD
jgi:hypothetical protein